MASSRLLKNQSLTSDERHTAIQTFCRQQNPLKKTAARLDAEKAERAAAAAAQTPQRGTARCRSPPSPKRDVRARRSTCATCVSFSQRDALRTASARARTVKGRGPRRYLGTGTGTYSALEPHHTLKSGQASIPRVKVRGTDPCEARLLEEERPRQRLPASGPQRWHPRKCQSPTILKPSVSDVPWGGTPREHLAPELPSRTVLRHPLENRAKGSPEYWQQQFDKLEDQIRGPLQDVARAWDALTPTILHRVAPILGIPMPTASFKRDDTSLPTQFTPPSEEKSDPIPFWGEISLPEEIPQIRVKVSDLAFKDWQFADIPERREVLPEKLEQPSMQKSMFPKDSMLKKKERVAEPDDDAKTEKLVNVQSLQDESLDGGTKMEQTTQETTETTTKETKSQKRLPTGEVVEITEIEVTTKITTEVAAVVEEQPEEKPEIEKKEFVKVFDSFADIPQLSKVSKEEHGEDQEQWYGVYKEEDEGEYFIGEYLRSGKGDKRESWGGELYITDSYLEARLAVIGKEALAEEMSEILDLINVDLEVHPPTTYPRDEGLFTCPGRPDNPYFNFISKTPKSAAIWRQHFKPETTGEAMDTAVLLHPGLNLPEKANHVTKQITSEFVDWMRGMGGVQPTELTEEVLQQLFDVTFDMPASHSLCVRVRELPVVTKQVAESCHTDQAEEQEVLRHTVRKDLAAEWRDQHLVAFEKMLGRCCPQRFIAPHNRVRETWIECRVPQTMATSRIVFEGITHLISVQRFCEWLDKHPNFDPPEYLKQVGMVGPNAQRGFHVRGISQNVRLTEGSIAEAGFINRTQSQAGVRPLRPSRVSRATVGSGRRSYASLGTTREQGLSSIKLDKLHKSLSAARTMAIL